MMNADMIEFKYCLNEIEVEDLCSSGLHFTWTKNLCKAKRAIDSDHHNQHLRINEAKLVEEFYEAEADEEKFLYQQAKIKWLCEGDKNSRHEGDQIPQVFLDHFQEFLGTSYQVQEIDYIETLIKKKLSLEEADKMVSEVSDKEIKEALFDIDDSKAPGPDGFSSAFFKKAWRVIGPDICKAVKEFFMSGKMLGELNATLISLIPKVQTPDKVTDFRPISCCNVLYKCISKVLTNKIKPILGKLVSCNQSALIPGRHIQDNIMLTQEVMRGCYFCESHQKALDIFSACSGLVPNNSKSTVFFGSMKEEEKIAISYVLPFAIGKLPVRYLGVPLIAKRLGVKDCGCLLDKIKNKIQNWKNKFLSYAGRLQLITAVLESIHVYWAQVFLLPAIIIKDINRLLKSFLWNQSEKTTGKAKVAWSSICRPKDQGGLGLKNLQIWTNALLAKHVWNIEIKKDSLWVKWVHSVKLRGKSIWDIKSRIGPLVQYLTHRDLYDERLNEELKVSDMIVNGMWSLPDEWYEKFPLITSLEVPDIEIKREDKIVWKTKFDKEVDFSVFQSTVSFCGLPYKIEDIKHLLFQCPFSKEVWCKAMDMTEVKDKEYEWEAIIQILIKASQGNNINSVVRRLIFAAIVYNIWAEKNRRIFQDKKMSSVDRIIDVAKSKISSLTVKDSYAIKMMERKWKISCKRLLCYIKQWCPDKSSVFGSSAEDGGVNIRDYEIMNRQFVKSDSTTYCFGCCALGTDGESVLREASKVSDVVNNSAWSWPSAWYDMFPVLINVPTPTLNDDQIDVLQWRMRDGSFRSFSVRDAWNCIRDQVTEVVWYRLVWSRFSIPRHTTHLWLVMRNRLKTHDRMRQWDVGNDVDINQLRCSLCKIQPNSHAHLFFECPYSSQIWFRVLHMAEIQFASNKLNGVRSWRGYSPFLNEIM
ncbi:pentatricopeptide repeat-containing protein [Tanacetum coccineum]